MFSMEGVDTARLRDCLENEPDSYDADFIPPEYFGRNNRFILVGLRKLMKKARADGLVIPNERTILIAGFAKGNSGST
jgi:hypothetical protein